jgi:hypothetical protein
MILDVAAVLAQMQGDAVAPGLLGDQGREKRIGYDTPRTWRNVAT